MKLTIDFETRSENDLKKSGPWVYAEHPSTWVICLAVKADSAPARVYVAPYFRGLLPENHGLPLISADEVNTLVETADIIEAHNVEFERAIWEHQRFPHSFVPLPVDKLRCSAAKAAVCTLPRSLDGACTALGLPVQKDKDGHRIMLKMCKPRKPTKNNPAPWHEDPEELAALCRYCIQDTEAEHALSEALPDLTPEELDVWRADQAINARGICCDLTSVNRAIVSVNRTARKLDERVKTLTGGSVTSARQVAACIDWLHDHQGVPVSDLQAGTVQRLLKSDALPGPARELLEIRADISKASVAKYRAMVARASRDGRIRSTTMYHGASTGRWSGKGIQPQNMPRAKAKNQEHVISQLHNAEWLALLYGSPFDAASRVIRGMLTAAPHYHLIGADLSSIEAITLAWLAGEDGVVKAFSEGLDLYKVAAARVYQKSYEDVTSWERQIGKVIVLACGYQGHIGAFQTMAQVYGVQIPDSQAADAVNAWRASNTRIVRFWYQIEGCFRAALAGPPGKVFTYRGIKVGKATGPGHGTARIQLPSGRVLYYYDPIVYTDDFNDRGVITYMGVDSYTRKWKRLQTYGGKLTENIIQAICRDLMAGAILRLEKEGYPVVLHVHDEAVSEVGTRYGSVQEYEAIMSEVPSWAAGLPIRAQGWRGKRYRKE